MRLRKRLIGALLTLALTGLAVAASVQKAPTGADEFRMSCAVCHGADARGDGPMAKLLRIKPTDLTELSKRNKGRFPMQQVIATIDGRTEVSGHGTREMPVWGMRFEAEVAREYGPYGSESVVKTRIVMLARYLESIQIK